jgi:hypothetical protein
MNSRTLFLVASVWALAACKPATQLCGPSTCNGCCDAAGECQPGSSNSACGVQGNTCDVCVGTQQCAGFCITPTPVCMPESDAELCALGNRQCGAATAVDRCNKPRTLDCGTCAAGQACNATNACVCQPETDAELCTAGNLTCGLRSVTDRCGRSRAVSCGTCSSGLTCQNNTCGCVNETDEQLCARAARNCGPLTLNVCGQSRTVTSCGTCLGTNTCQAGTCSCAPESNVQFCARLGATCGTVTAPDLCGQQRSVSCGSCPLPNQCGGGGTANQCGCTPETDAEFCSRKAKNCGAVTANDNCGAARAVASCGTCAGTQTCGGGGSTNVCGCMRETDAAFLLRLGKNCGTVTALDSCGLTRTVFANSCAVNTTCGGGGTANVCGCTAPTDAELCTQSNNVCGPSTVVDRCGTSRTVDCGNCMSGTRCTTSASNRTCQTFTCSSGQRACGATCANCPLTGVATTQCGAGDTCVAATCATDFTLVGGVCQPATCPGTDRSCGGVCRTCPTTNVATTTCSGPACIAATCVDGTGLSGGACVPMACGAGQLFCSTACAVCPTAGATTFACSASTCLASGCAAGFSLRNGRCVDSDWSLEVVDASASALSSGPPRSAALAVDASGAVHVAYVDSPNIVVAKRTATGWVRTSVVALAPNGLTAVTGLAVDAQGNAHVIFYDWHSIGSFDSTYAYRYVKIAPGGTMSLQLTLGDTYYSSGGALVADEGIALTLDAAGDAHLAWNTLVTSTRRLKYARTYQGAWVTPIDATTTEVPYPVIAVDAAGVVHIAGVSGTSFLYTKGVNSLFSAPITVASGATASLKDPQLFLSASGLQLWANAGRNFWTTSLAGAVLATPVVWGTQTGSAYVAGAPWASGFSMLEQTSGGVSPTGRSGPFSGPTLIEPTNLPLPGTLARGAVVDANGTFHGLALRYVSGPFELSYVRGH